MVIEKFKKMANNRYKIVFKDCEIITYDEVIINNNLLYKKEIDEDLYSKILEENKYYDLYNKCIKLISNKMRSVSEIETYLSKNEASKKDIQNIIDKLINIGLLNDLRYTKAYVSDKMKFTNAGPYKIEKELLDLGIDQDIIKKELSHISEEDIKNKITKYINMKLRKNKYSEYIFKQKVITELINMGYSKDDILEKLDSVHMESNINKEYDKLYNKLSKKYDGNELYLNLKNKLYQKGYTKEEIDTLKKMD